MPERNKLQAQFPRGSRVVPNPDGTAPGIDFTVPRANGTLVPRDRAARRAGRNVRDVERNACGRHSRQPNPTPRVICHRRIKCFGVGESDLEAMLPDMIRRKREPLVGITVHGATITLRITASGPNEAACRQAMEPTVAEIRKLLGVLVFGEEDDELEHAVVRLLNERGRTLAVAEWATDGLVSQWLAEAAAGERLLSRRDRRARCDSRSNRCCRYRVASDQAAAAGNRHRDGPRRCAKTGAELRSRHRGISIGGTAVAHRRCAA